MVENIMLCEKIIVEVYKNWEHYAIKLGCSELNGKWLKS
jgi:hypothetical protein